MVKLWSYFECRAIGLANDLIWSMRERTQGQFQGFSLGNYDGYFCQLEWSTGSSVIWSNIILGGLQGFLEKINIFELYTK